MCSNKAKVDMIVYACFEHYFNGCEEFVSLIKIVADEEKVLLWKEEPFTSDPDRWRDYKEFSVE